MPNQTHITHFLKHPVVTSLLTLVIAALFGWFLTIRDISSWKVDHMDAFSKVIERVEKNTDKLSKQDNMELRLALLEEGYKTVSQNMNQLNISVGITQNDISHVKASMINLQTSVASIESSNRKILEIIDDRK